MSCNLHLLPKNTVPICTDLARGPSVDLARGPSGGSNIAFSCSVMSFDSVFSYILLNILAHDTQTPRNMVWIDKK